VWSTYRRLSTATVGGSFRRLPKLLLAQLSVFGVRLRGFDPRQFLDVAFILPLVYGDLQEEPGMRGCDVDWTRVGDHTSCVSTVVTQRAAI